MKNLPISPKNPPKNKVMISTIFLGAAITALICMTPAYAQSSKTLNIEGFSAIKAEAGVNVVYKKSNNYDVQTELQSGSDHTVRIKKRGDTLYIARKTEKGWADGKTRVTVKVSGPELNFIAASSGAKVTATDLEAQILKIRVDSGGRVLAAGRCGRLSSQADSGGVADLSKVKCDQVAAKAYSGGGLKLYASESIKTRTDSGGSIRVFGTPPERDVKPANGSYGGRTIFEKKD
ncbi:MAG: DUF2807 domain-containing protein [Hellea sp.]